MKTIVIYKSATGFTRNYARWIAEAVSADLFALADVTLEKVLAYDCIVFGGRLYAVGIDGISLITKNFEKLRDKKVIVFATGASPAREAVRTEVLNNNFSPQQQAQIDFYYLRGGFDYAALPRFDKILMYLLKKKIQRKQKKGEKLSADEAGMLKLYDRVTDFTREKNIVPIVERIKQ